MKKLMIAAAAAAMVGGAFAADVYDYKASVKYVDMQKKVIVIPFVGKAQMDVKVVKSTTLSGYLVTSPECGCLDEASSGAVHGFLVIRNPKSTGDKGVKVMPANLLVGWWSNKIVDPGKKATFDADGYLFAGLGKQAVPAPGAYPAYDFGDPTTKGTYKMMGAYNMIEPGSGAFIEAWLDAAGFGKVAFGDESIGCAIGHEVCLKNLAGSVIGGSWLCAQNGNGLGYLDDAYLCWGWNTATPKLMEVISGTWSIKANQKVQEWIEANVDLNTAEQALVANSTAETLILVKGAAQQMAKGWTLTNKSITPTIGGTPDNSFATTWF